MTSEADVKKCRICMDDSTGKHFGAEACRACAAFFRRATVLNIEFTCSSDGNCNVGKESKTCCKGCRQKKCRQVGMDHRYVQRNRDHIGPKLSHSQPSSSSSASSPSTSASNSSSISTQFSQIVHISAPIDETRIPLISEFYRMYKTYKSLQKAAQMVYEERSVLIPAVYPEQTFLRPENFAFFSHAVKTHLSLVKQLSAEAMEELVKKSFAFFSAQDLSFLSSQNFPDKDDTRIMLTLKHYSSADGFHDFFKLPKDFPIPPLLQDGYKRIITNSKYLIINPMTELKLSEHEFAGIVAVSFFQDNDIESVNEEDLRVISENNEIAYDELYYMCQCNASSMEEARLRFSKMISLMPMGHRIIESLRNQEGLCSMYVGCSNDFEKEMLPHSF